MVATSVVLSNLMYLVGAVVLATVGCIVVALRHRRPKSLEANVSSFSRGLAALAPDERRAAARGSLARTVRPSSPPVAAARARPASPAARAASTDPPSGPGRSPRSARPSPTAVAAAGPRPADRRSGEGTGSSRLGERQSRGKEAEAG